MNKNEGSPFLDLSEGSLVILSGNGVYELVEVTTVFKGHLYVDSTFAIGEGFDRLTGESIDYSKYKILMPTPELLVHANINLAQLEFTKVLTRFRQEGIPVDRMRKLFNNACDMVEQFNHDKDGKQ